ncbi:MAG: HAD family hydrolase [Erythrobacter sp.]|uniref:HAD family hydrolase n=1 Tax=Erythrobacter sp. TaxID=1042 RepID=UPI00260C3A6B|nr:HAD family hydrolase [Erythrobacter sp.]MDJ0979483.1 HAD family hydrolase [Erythrobacter sp.]
MTRPLIISDCDEVLLHMVAPFKVWLESSQGVDFNLEGHNFAEALRWQSNGDVLEGMDVWKMLGRFFDTQMDTQEPIAGAVEAINALSEHADVVVLTNLVDERREKRADQLAGVGICAPVYTNQGPKGPPLKAILEEHGRDRPAFFIDDLAQHHVSVKEVAPRVTRLHMCGEPMIAGEITCAHKEGHADARIDRWDEALPWLINRMEKEAA